MQKTHNKEKFELYVDMSKVNSSMELDSGIEVARFTRGPLVATLEIRGEVKVDYKGNRYRCASQMPPELIAMFHDWKEGYEKKVDVDMNNWPEVFIWLRKGKKLEWTGYSDVADAEGLPPEEIQALLAEYLDYYEKNALKQLKSA